MQAWTYSQIDSFNTCPKQFYHMRVVRDFVEKPSEQQLWGEQVHKAFEHRILTNTPLPEGMQQWEPLAGKLASIMGDKYCEHKFSVSDSFKPVPYKEAWSRGIADLFIHNNDKAGVFDYKTGRSKPSFQLGLYAGYVFSTYPEVTTVATGFLWLKEKKITKEVFTRSDVATIWLYFLPSVRRLEEAHTTGKWPARPSGLCKGWCAVTSCVHNQNKRKG